MADRKVGHAAQRKSDNVVALLAKRAQQEGRDEKDKRNGDANDVFLMTLNDAFSIVLLAIGHNRYILKMGDGVNCLVPC